MSLNDSAGDDSVGSAAGVDSGAPGLDVFASDVFASDVFGSDILGLDMRRLQRGSVIPP